MTFHVSGFMCHEQGASALILAPQHQLLISGGKKGDINIFDVRQRQQRHRFQAHESAIKCLALDPHEEFFVSGAGDGDIKVNDHFYKYKYVIREYEEYNKAQPVSFTNSK
jgi:WD40 repeat protein